MAKNLFNDYLKKRSTSTTGSASSTYSTSKSGSNPGSRAKVDYKNSVNYKMREEQAAAYKAGARKRAYAKKKAEKEGRTWYPVYQKAGEGTQSLNKQVSYNDMVNDYLEARRNSDAPQPVVTGSRRYPVTGTAHVGTAAMNKTSGTVPASLVRSVAATGDNNVARITRQYALAGSKATNPEITNLGDLRKDDYSFKTDNYVANRIAEERRKAAARTSAAAAGELAAKHYVNQLNADKDAAEKRAAAGVTPTVLSDEAKKNLAAYIASGKKDATSFVRPEKTLGVRDLTSDSYENTREYEAMQKLINPRKNNPNMSAVENAAYNTVHNMLGLPAAVGVEIGTNMASGMEGLANNVKGIVTGEKPSDNDLYGASQAAGFREGILRGVRDVTGNEYDGVRTGKENVTDFLTGVGLDMANSVARAHMLGGVGGSLQASGSAANDSYLDTAHDDSVSAGQANALAAVNAFNEGFFEHFSIENYLKMSPANSLKAFKQNLLKTMAVEGEEEGATEIGNIIGEMLILRDKSQYMQEYKNRIASGEDSRDALVNTVVSAAGRIGQATIGGALSGIGSTGTRQLTGTLTNSMDFNDTWNHYSGSYNNAYQEIADAIDPSTASGVDAKRTAEEYAERVKNGGTVSAMEKGVLQNAIDNAASEQKRVEKHEEIAANESLDERTRAAAAEYAEAARNGEEYTEEEDNFLRKANEEALEAAADESPEEETTPEPTGNGYGEKPEGISDALWREITAEPYNMLSNEERSKNLKHRAAEVGLASQIRDMETKALDSWSKEYGTSGQQAFKDNFQSGMRTTDYVRAFNKIYDAGRYNVPIGNIDESYAALISNNDTFENIYKAGANDARTLYDEATKLSYRDRQEERIGGVLDAYRTVPEDVKGVFESLGKKTGIQFVLVDSRYDEGAGENALGSYKGDGIITVDVNPNQDGANIMQTTSHEMTHWLQEYAPMEYQMFKEEAIRAIMKSSSTTLDEEIEKRRAAGYTGTREEITDEIVADSTGTFLNDADFAKNIAENQPKMATRIVEWLKSMANALKELISTKNIRKAAAALKEDLKAYESTRDMWMIAVDEASEKMKTSTIAPQSEDRMQKIVEDYKNSTDEELEKYIEDVINGEKVIPALTVKDEVTDRLAEAIESAVGVNAKNYRVEIRPTEVTHIWNRHGTKGAADHSMKKIENIARMGYVLDNFDDAVPGGRKSKAFKNSDNTLAETVEIKKRIGNSIYHVVEAVPVTKARKMNTITAFIEDIKIEAVDQVGNTENGDALYVRNELHPTTSDINISSEEKESQRILAEETKKRYQKVLKENGVDAEETGNLVAVHNVNLDKIGKMLDMSSLPMPSIAITKADMGWNDFGSVSFVFRKSTIDPKADRRNRVYGADAWTPTFANLSIENEVDDDVRANARAIIKKETEGKIPAYLASEATQFIDARANDIAENGTFDDLIDQATHDRGMQAAYIASKGETLSDNEKTVNEPTITEEKISFYKAMIKEFGSELDGASKMPIKKILEDYGTRIQKVYKEHLIETGVDAATVEKRSNAFLNSKFGMGGYTGWRAVNAFTGAEKFKETGIQYKERIVRDEEATRDEIRKKLDKDGFKSWLEDLFSGIITGSGIRNNVDPYTPSGNRRSFAATHYSVTPENIVRAMIESRDGKSKAVTTPPGIRGIIAAGSSEFSSIDEIHKDEGRLQPKDEDVNIDELENRLQEVEQKISDQGSYKDIDAIEDAITEAAGKKRVTAAAIRKAFDWYGWIKYTESDVNEILDIIKEARRVPTDMFEAKPERTVDFSEVAHVLVPDGISEDILTKLADKGLDVVTYDSEVEGDRTEKLKSLDGVRFQLGIDETAMPAPVYAESEKLDQATDDLSKLIINARNVMPSSQKITRLTSELAKEWNSNVDRTMVRQQIEKLYASMAVSTNANGHEFADTAAAIGGEILDHAVIKDAEQEERWSSFKKTLRNTIIYIPASNIHDIEPEGFNALRKRYFQKINFTTDQKYMEHTGADAYRELKQQFPDYFTLNPDQMYDVDAVQEIMNVRDNGGPVLESGTPNNAQDYNETAYALGERILKTFFDEADQDTRKQYMDTYHSAIIDLRVASSRELKRTRAALETRYNRNLALLKKRYAANNLAIEDYVAEKAKLDEKLKAASLDRAAMAERLRKHKEDYVKRQRKATDIKRMESSMRKIQKMIEQPTDKNHVPAPLAKGIQQLFSTIDLTTDYKGGKANELRRKDYERLQSLDFTNALGDFKNVVNAVMKDEGILTDPETGIDTRITLDPDFLTRLENQEAYIEEMAKEHEGIPKVRKMPYERVHELYQMIQSINHMLEYANKFTTLDRNTTVSAFAERTMGELRGRKATATYSSSAQLRKEIQRTLREGMLDSPTFFNLIGGDGGTGDEMYAALRNGLDKKAVAVNESMKYIERTMNELDISGKEVQQWSQKTRTVKLGNKTLTVTDAQLMELYVLNKREQARKHMYGNSENLETTRVNGGIQFDSVSGKNKKELNRSEAARYISEADVAAVVDLLSPKQKQLAERMQHFLATSVSNWGNETSMNLYGYEKFLEPSYWPIRTASDYRATKTSDIERGMTTLANMGFTKATVNSAQNPIVIGNIFDTFTNHIDKMSSYNAFLPALEDMQKWLNYQDGYQSMKVVIKDAMSEDALDFMNNLILDLNGSRGRADKWGNLANIFLGKAKGVAVSWTLSVAIQQPFSIVRAAAEMNPKYIAAAMSPANLAKRKEAWKTAQKYAPITIWKQIGGPDISTGRTLKSAIFGSTGIIDTLNEWGMKGAEIGDRITWTTLWQAAEEEVKDTRKDLEVGSPGYYAAAKKVYDHVIDFTQVVDSPLHRTEMMKSKSDLAKIATAFKSEPMKTYDMLYREIYKATHGTEEMKAKARANIGKIVAVIVGNILVTNAAKSVMGALRDPDKDRTYGDRWLDAFFDNIGIGGFLDALDPENKNSERWIRATLNFAGSDLSILSTMPYVGNIIDTINGYTSNIETQSFADLARGANMLFKIATGKQSEGVLGSIYKLSPILHLFNISSKNMMKWTGAIIDEVIMDAGFADAEYVRNRLMLSIKNDKNTKTFVAEAMKEYARGNKDLGDKIMQDLVKAGIDEAKIQEKVGDMLAAEPELELAARSYANGAKDDYESLRQQLIQKGYSEEIVDKKLDSAIDKLAPAGVADVATAIYEGNNKDTVDAYINYMQNIGKSDDDIRKNVQKAMTEKYKAIYKSSDRATQRKIEQRLETLQVLKENIYTVKDFYYGSKDKATGQFIVDSSKGLKWAK